MREKRHNGPVCFAVSSSSEYIVRPGGHMRAGLHTDKDNCAPHCSMHSIYTYRGIDRRVTRSTYFILILIFPHELLLDFTWFFLFFFFFVLSTYIPHQGTKIERPTYITARAFYIAVLWLLKIKRLVRGWWWWCRILEAHSLNDKESH